MSDVLNLPPEDRTAGTDPSDLTPVEGTVTDFLTDAHDLAGRWGPDAAMMAIPIPGGRLLGAARASRITGLSSGIASQAANAASRTSPRASAILGRGVSRARNTLRKVNPRRQGTPADAAPAPPPSLTRGDRGAVRAANQMTGASPQGAPATTTLGAMRQRTFPGAVQRARSSSRFPRPLSGQRGILARAGAGEGARGAANVAARSAAALTGLGIGSQLTVAVAEGLLSDTSRNLKDSQDLTDADNQAINTAIRQASEGNRDAAAQTLSDQGITQDQVANAISAAEQDADQRNSPLLDQDQQSPGRTLNSQIDSLAGNAAENPGVPPTANAAIQAQQNPQAAAQLDQIRGQLSRFGQLPATEVVTGFQSPTERGGLLDDPLSQPSAFASPVTRPINEVAGQILDMDQDRLTDLQHKLFAAGFYGNTPYDNIRFGARTPDTFSAFQGFLEQAAVDTQRSQAQGDQPAKWDSLLERWTMEAGGVEGAIDEQMGDPQYTVQLTDPEAIKSSLDNLATNVIGQGVSPEVQQRFVSMFHGQQRQAQIAQQESQREARRQQLQAQSNRAMATRETTRQSRAGQGQPTQGQAQDTETQPTVTEVTQPNVQAQGQSFLESEFPVQSEAQGRVSAYDEFLSMIGAS